MYPACMQCHIRALMRGTQLRASRVKLPPPFHAGATAAKCANNNGGCSPRAVCLDTPTGPSCACPISDIDSGDGKTCTGERVGLLCQACLMHAVLGQRSRKEAGA
jgi:hypothetical protein